MSFKILKLRQWFWNLTEKQFPLNTLRLKKPQIANYFTWRPYFSVLFYFIIISRFFLFCHSLCYAFLKRLPRTFFRALEENVCELLYNSHKTSISAGSDGIEAAPRARIPPNEREIFFPSLPIYTCNPLRPGIWQHTPQQCWGIDAYVECSRSLGLFSIQGTFVRILIGGEKANKIQWGEWVMCYIGALHHVAATWGGLKCAREVDGGCCGFRSALLYFLVLYI